MTELETDEMDARIQQFPPGVYDVLGTSGSLVARVLSLGSTLPSAPGVSWKKNKEHWFSVAGLDLDTALNDASIDIRYAEDLGSLEKVALQLADPAEFTFQLYAKGILTPASWISGQPTITTPAYYFVQTPLPGDPNRAMRPLFMVNPNDALMLSSIAWFTLDNTVTSYFQNVSPGTTIKQDRAATSTIPTNGWYYIS